MWGNGNGSPGELPASNLVASGGAGRDLEGPGWGGMGFLEGCESLGGSGKGAQGGHGGWWEARGKGAGVLPGLGGGQGQDVRLMSELLRSTWPCRCVEWIRRGTGGGSWGSNAGVNCTHPGTPSWLWHLPGPGHGKAGGWFSREDPALGGCALGACPTMPVLAPPPRPPPPPSRSSGGACPGCAASPAAPASGCSSGRAGPRTGAGKGWEVGEGTGGGC